MEHHPTGNRADFPLVLAHVDRWSTSLGSNADMSAGRKALLVRLSITERAFAARVECWRQRSNVQGVPWVGTTACGGGARSGTLSRKAVIHHREVGHPQAVKRVDQCLSRMR